ncbi:MAG: outer membrane beta-barrel protein [Candidatus Krumholzibacteria bacterium]|nr:outer membrane beta-barrel protein [Candidatus Krumholzibacteria bacterium]
MVRKIMIAAWLFTLISTQAWAQYRQPPARSVSQPLSHQFEITPFGGYSWTFSRRVNLGFPVNQSGDLDFTSSPFWGVELDITLQPGAQLALLYSRQDTDLTFKSGGLKKNVTSMSVEYFQVGAVGGVKQGNILPFGMMTLGATRFAYDTPGQGDTWKFSMIFGLGAKIYATDRIGLRVQARLPFTLVSGGAGIGCGFDGCYTTVGGSGIAQFDVSAALMLMF